MPSLSRITACPPGRSVSITLRTAAERSVSRPVGSVASSAAGSVGARPFARVLIRTSNVSPSFSANRRAACAARTEPRLAVGRVWRRHAAGRVHDHGHGRLARVRPHRLDPRRVEQDTEDRREPDRREREGSRPSAGAEPAVGGRDRTKSASPRRRPRGAARAPARSAVRTRATTSSHYPRGYSMHGSGWPGLRLGEGPVRSRPRPQTARRLTGPSQSVRPGHPIPYTNSPCHSVTS